MWYLKSIAAENLCSFEELNYDLTQNTATLVFGNNMDSDSQNSNGAGKSALIESVAVLLTGEPLRKVNIDELINDAFNDLKITGVLCNDDDNTTMQVVREFSRKKPQSISIIVNGEAVAQSGIADYNKYVLDKLGITKDDVYSNFILTARKYKSFLSSSDKDKKDIINRFSNGVIVDESIEALQNDIKPIEEQLTEAEKKVAECNGKVSAMAETIERTINESANRQSQRKESIEAHKQSIANKRAEIRDINKRMDASEDKLDKLDKLDADIQALEEQELSVQELTQSIKDLFKEAGLGEPKDFSSEATFLARALEANQKRRVEAEEQIAKCKDAVTLAEHKFAEMQKTYDNQIAQFAADSDKIKADIDQLLVQAKELRSKEQELDTKRRQTESRITRLEAEISGAVTCPKCNHSFLLSNNTDLNEAVKTRDILKVTVTQLGDEIEQRQKEYDKCKEEGQRKRSEETALQTKKDDFLRAYKELQTGLETCQAQVGKAQAALDDVNDSAKRTQTKLDNIRKDIFDDAYHRIDNETEEEEANLKKGELEISTIEGVIKSLEKAIEELESSSNEESLLASLSETKAKNEQELVAATQAKERIEHDLNVLKVQEGTFLEFKTHLANTKIEAISQIINEFLEAIGSDIRVSLSGYSVTKTGKIRDKISVSLLRDGIDCGSFDKFSKGEQTRVELASILALHKLINVNAESSKGLNLLIIDEILDATDEQGLANVFKALNDTQITSLVVSHGNIAESYPNRLVINKQNGVSFI